MLFVISEPPALKKIQHIFFSQGEYLFSNSFVHRYVFGCNQRKEDAVGQLRGSDIRAHAPVAPGIPCKTC